MIPEVLSRMAKPVRRQLISKPHSNLLHRLLHPRRFLSTLVQRVAMAMTLERMQTPVPKIDGMWGLVQMQTDHLELLLPSSLPQQIKIATRHTVQDADEAVGLTDKAVTWVLAPVFFCCVMAEKVSFPRWQSWASTEVFSRVVVTFMLKLFVLTRELGGGEQQKQRVRRLEEGK